MMPDRICSQRSTVRGSSCNPSGPIAKESSSVSSSPRDADGLPTTNSSTRWSVVESDRDDPSASHVACLRERYRNDYLTTKASEHMLVSWRTKSFQSYNFLFGKWARWCTHNPISNPTPDIANFLAHLHETSYQFKHLNAYRSANLFRS